MPEQLDSDSGSKLSLSAWECEDLFFTAEGAGSLSPFVHVDTDGSRPSFSEETGCVRSPTWTSVANPHTVNMAGLTPKWGYPVAASADAM